VIIKPLQLRGTHLCSFRKDEWARIIAVVMVSWSGKLEPRPCFMVQYADSFIDYVPMSDMENYELQEV
jgi:hypothetical protein